MTTADDRYPVKIEVQDGLGRDAVLGGGVADGRGKFLLARPREDGQEDAVLTGFSVSPAQCRALKELVDAMFAVLDARGQS